MRILGIDPGDRRIGLAMSDELGITAQGLDTFQSSTDGDVIKHVVALVKQHGIDEIVVGHPVHLSGDASPSSEKAVLLAEKLRRRCDGVRVTLWDERLSSAEAKRTLRGTRAKKGTIDRLAAVLILQSYLDYRRRPC